MGGKYKFHESNYPYFLTFTVIHWIDVFIRQEYRDIIYESIRYCQLEKGLEVYGYCIMPSHIHMIIGKEKGRLSDVVRDLKAFTSRHIRKSIETHQGESRKEWMTWMMKRAGVKNERNKDWQFWQQHNHPIELPTINLALQRLHYIHNNPVAAGFVNRPEDWIHSSAGDYMGIQTGRADLVFIE